MRSKVSVEQGEFAEGKVRSTLSRVGSEAIAWMICKPEHLA